MERFAVFQLPLASVLLNKVFFLYLQTYTLETGRDLFGITVKDTLVQDSRQTQSTKRQALAMPMAVPLAAKFIWSAEFVLLNKLGCGMCTEFVRILYMMFCTHSMLEQLFFYDFLQCFIVFYLMKICGWCICTCSICLSV